MVLEFGDWRFDVNVEATWERTARYSFDHCECAYCRNYYDTVDRTYPLLRGALASFGIHPEGPCELMPFEPTRMLACYRVDGKILQWGKSNLYANGVQLLPEDSDDDTFLLWVGELELPWVQKEKIDEVVSPANLPEFMDRMRQVWLLRYGEEFVFS